MSKLNQRVIQARKGRGLSQANLAERLGVTRTAISHWETGRSNPSTKHLKSIAQILGVDANWPITGKAPTAPKTAPAKGRGSPNNANSLVLENQSGYGAMFDQETLKVAAAYFALDRAKRKIIRDMLKALGSAS
jgi:transcriptional regulator with XRE-family HTH domain